VVQGQDAGNLFLDRIEVRRALHLPVNPGVVLTQDHADMLSVTVDTEGQPHHPVERGSAALAKSERRALSQRERPDGFDRELSPCRYGTLSATTNRLGGTRLTHIHGSTLGGPSDTAVCSSQAKGVWLGSTRVDQEKTTR
jgi:hypothetical protein